MITIYTTPSCSSCRKAKKWLEEYGLQYREKNLFVTPLTADELRYILERTENGTEDIISRRSKVIMEGDIDIDSMSLNNLIEFVQTNPSVLRRPIIIDDKRLQVGYNDDEIRTFVPRELRDLCVSCESCEKYPTCQGVRGVIAN
ncbi:MAG: transcriptional regulator Spx [Culicoidibacterales bacterium]